MIRYEKGPAPSCLTGWHATPGANWSSLGKAERDEIRPALVRDQSGLCAYCQLRLSDEDAAMKIEHWRARMGDRTDFQWSNMLGCCAGVTEGDRHCDTARGNVPLFLHPVEGQGPDPRDFLRYLGDGSVTSDDPRATADVETLELNAPALKRGRKKVLDAVRLSIAKSRDPVAEKRRLLDRHTTRSGERAPEFAEFVRYHVQRRLRVR